MPTYKVVEINTYTVEAESLGDCQFVYKQYSTEGEFADDVELLKTQVDCELVEE
jgi:hypothetical protein